MRACSTALKSSAALCTSAPRSANRNSKPAASAWKVATLPRTTRAAVSAAIFPPASAVSSASCMLAMLRRPLMAPAKSAGPTVTRIGAISAFRLATCSSSARRALATASSLTSVLRRVTSLSRPRRTVFASAPISSSARNRASMSAVCDSACSFAAFSRLSTSAHHFTALSASAKSWSVFSVRLTARMVARAVALNSARFDAVTAPVTSMRSAGSRSGALPTGVGAAEGGRV